MRYVNMSRVPNASAVPPGAIVNVTTPEEHGRLRVGLVGLLLLSGVVGGTAGYFVGRAGMPSRNPRRRRRKKKR